MCQLSQESSPELMRVCGRLQELSEKKAALRAECRNVLEKNKVLCLMCKCRDILKRNICFS